MIGEDEELRLYRSGGEEFFYTAVLIFGTDNEKLDEAVSLAIDRIYLEKINGCRDGRIIGQLQESFWNGFDAKRQETLGLVAGETFA